MVDMQAIPCKDCDGKMRPKAFKHYSPILTVGLIVLGVIFSVTIIGVLLGIPLIVLALHLGSKEDYFWVCDKCKKQLLKRF